MAPADRRRMLILGAGPAGLAIARTLSDAGAPVTIAEGSDRIGGLSTTIEFAGGLVDLGPHVIGAAYPRVNDLFEDALREDTVRFQRRTTMLWRDRVFSYPPGLLEIAKGLGVAEAARICVSYALARATPDRAAPDNYRQAANRKFGKRLVDTCIAPYLEKLWGMACEHISGEWEPGRVRNQSLLRLALDALSSRTDRTVAHPRLGAKQFYDKLAESMADREVTIALNQPVSKIRHDGARVTAVEFQGHAPIAVGPGAHHAVFSTLPLPALVAMLDPAPPQQITDASRCLTFRNTILIYLLVDGPSGLDDHIRYINDHRFAIGRVTNFSIWTDGMARATATPPRRAATLCAELWSGFDGVWREDDQTLLRRTTGELVRLGVMADQETLDHMVLRVPRTHPVCTNEAVRRLREVQAYLATIRNLHVAGRAGSFLYADQDRVIDSSMQLAEAALGDPGDRP